MEILQDYVFKFCIVWAYLFDVYVSNKHHRLIRNVDCHVIHFGFIYCWSYEDNEMLHNDFQSFYCLTNKHIDIIGPQHLKTWLDQLTTLLWYFDTDSENVCSLADVTNFLSNLSACNSIYSTAIHFGIELSDLCAPHNTDASFLDQEQTGMNMWGMLKSVTLPDGSPNVA